MTIQFNPMRALILILALLASSASADEALWVRLKAEPNLVVLHTETGRGNPLHRDESGYCRGDRPHGAGRVSC